MGKTKKFSPVGIKALKPKAHIYNVREKDGFAVRVFPSGKKSWVFLYTVDGRKRRMTLGTCDTLTLAEARIKYGEAYKLLKGTHTDPAEVKKQAKQDHFDSATVDGLIHEYIEKWAKKRKRSWQADERALQKDVSPRWGKSKAKDITKRDVVLLLEDIVSRGAPIVANRTFDKAVRRSDEPVFRPAGIKHFTPHDLRRTAATHMTAMGISRLIVSKILNHADNSITAIYDRHSYDSEKRIALDKCEQAHQQRHPPL